MLRIQVFAVVMGMYMLGGATRAEDEFLGSVRLRGGYDGNPQFSSGERPIGSAFLATDVALAAGGKDGSASWALTTEASTTRYANPQLVPSSTGKVMLKGTMGDDELRMTSTTTLADVSSYNLRASDFTQIVKLESRQDKVKLFVTAEGGRSALNQTNAIYEDFLPQALTSWRGAIIPGVSVISGKAEVGVSVNLSARRYTEELDLFGYRRDNERVQPFVFARYDGDDVTAFASVSKLYGKWHDVDFSDVERTLFDAQLSWRPAKMKGLTLDLSVARRSGETSFPISPITIDTLVTAKAGWQVDAKLLLTAVVGYASIEYLDSPFRQDTTTVGVGMSREIFKDLKWGMDLSRTTGTLINGERANAFMVASSITKSFAPGEKVEEKAKGMK